MATYIETERLLLRDWTVGDRTLFAEMNADPAVMEFFPSVLSREESDAFARRIEDELRECGAGLFALELKSTGEFIGYTGFHRFSFPAPFSPGWEIGWRLASRFHRQGYASEAARACLEYGRRAGLATRIYSFTAVPNTPSERVMQKIGMTFSGTFMHPALPDDHPLREHKLYCYDYL